MDTKKTRINISGWTGEHDKALETVYTKLKGQGLTFDHDGKPNTSAILLYLLLQEAKKKK